MKFVLASHNQGKLKEMQTILSQLGVEVVMESDVGLALEVEETGTTFAENAELKARAVMEASGLPAIADDSGLCVDWLQGGPGIYSARYGGDLDSDEARCRLLLHLVDAAGSEGRDPIDDIEKINAELAGYSEFLAARPQIIVANKTDLLGEDREPVEKLRKYAEEHGFLFAELSAATNQGVRELMNLTWHELQQLPPVFVYEPEFVETEAAPVTENDWTIERDGDAYVVTGAWVDKVMGSVNLDDYESRQYMDRMLQTAGIYAKLEEMGIEENAPVIIGELEFEYVY